MKEGSEKKKTNIENKGYAEVIQASLRTEALHFFEKKTRIDYSKMLSTKEKKAFEDATYSHLTLKVI